MNSKTFVKVECMRWESFDVKVEVRQGLVLSSLLSAVAMFEVAKDMKEGNFCLQMTWNYSGIVERKWNFDILDRKEHQGTKF